MTLDGEKNFDASKKSLAFMFAVGVASASVQGLKIAQRASDGETCEVFGGWFGANSEKDVSWRVGASAAYFVWTTLSKFPSPKVERELNALSAQRFAERN